MAFASQPALAAGKDPRVSALSAARGGNRETAATHQRIYRGENIGRKRFLGIEKLLTGLGEAISRIVSRDEGIVEADHASTRSPDRSNVNANHK